MHQKGAQVSATAKKGDVYGGDKKGGKGELESLRIERTENGGFIVHCSHAPKKSEGGLGGIFFERDKPYAFASGKDMLAYVAEAFGVKSA